MVDKVKYKISRYYLFFVGILFILVGLEIFSEIVIYSHIPDWAPTIILAIYVYSLLLISGLFSYVIIPESMYYTSLFRPVITNPILLLYLSVISIILGILGIISLKRIKSSIKWIYVWYIISAVSVITLLYNLVHPRFHNSSEYSFFIFLYLFPLSLFIATYLVNKESK